MHNILITGASGLIGSRLTALLVQRHHHVSHLSRTPREGRIKAFGWDIDKGTIDADAFEGIDTIIHLAGAGVADKRWTKDRKKEILESRTLSTELLFEELNRRNHSVRTFISASGINYYDATDNETVFKETDKPGTDFLADVVKQWEAAADKMETLGIRVVKVRIGFVLSDKGGALKAMAKPVKFFVGAPLGSGKQNQSWIHIDDLCAMFIKAMEDDKMRGAYNGTGPYPVTNEELTRAIANALGRPLFLPNVPPFILKLMLGEVAEIVLNGNKVSSEKIQAEGFRFRFNDLDTALRDLLVK